MTLELKESCAICLNHFNEAEHKSVSLPCGHDFCLMCLVRLRTSGSHKCPRCGDDWAQMEMNALAGMASGARAQKGEEDERCSRHKLAYDFWRNKDNEFYCKKCISDRDVSLSEVHLIDDAVPLIRADIGNKVAAVNAELKQELEKIDEFDDNFRVRLRHVSEFKDMFQKLEEKLQEFILEADALRSKIQDCLTLSKKVGEEKEEIKSGNDVARMLSSRGTLDSIMQNKACGFPALQTPESLLCNIACTYMKSEEAEELPSPAFFIDLAKATKNSTLNIAKAQLEEDNEHYHEFWPVDNSNIMIAILALRESQPQEVTLTDRHNVSEDLSAAAVAAFTKLAKDCAINLELVNSFDKPSRGKTDQVMLEHVLDNSSLRLTHFRGHLNTEGIAKLPTTIQRLGLAICSEAVAHAVSNLIPWDGLLSLGVSVSSDVEVGSLSKLPRVASINLSFPGLTDVAVDSVRPAIETLVPDLEFEGLSFPGNQLTDEGIRRLTEQLDGVTSSYTEILRAGFGGWAG